MKTTHCIHNEVHTHPDHTVTPCKRCQVDLLTLDIQYHKDQVASLEKYRQEISDQISKGETK